MNVLVTGADGFLGAHLCDALEQAGHSVTAMCLNRKGHTSLDALGVSPRIEYGDITDAAYVRRVVNAVEPGWIFHLAAVSIVRVAEQDPARAYQTNIMGTVNVCEAAKVNGVRRVVVASTDKAYGDQGTDAPTEDAPLLARHPYEVSKACADMIARSYGAVVTRCANLYGPADLNWSRLIPNSCRLVAQGKPPELHTGAAQGMREWLHVRDAASAYLLLAESGTAGDAYNVGSGDLRSPAEIARWIAVYGGIDAVGESGRIIGEIPYQRVNWDKIKALGYAPQRGIERDLPRIWQWYRDYLTYQVKRGPSPCA